MRLGIVVGISALVMLVGTASARGADGGGCEARDVAKLLRVCRLEPPLARQPIDPKVWCCFTILGVAGIAAWAVAKTVEICGRPAIERLLVARELAKSAGKEGIDNATAATLAAEIRNLVNHPK